MENADHMGNKRRGKMKKYISNMICVSLIAVMSFAFAACGSTAASDENSGENIEVTVFAAASLNDVMQEFKEEFEAENKGVTILINADSSGALMTQIKEGAPCDLFFSAAQKQMNELEDEGLIITDTRRNVVNNKLVVVTQPDSETAVTGLADIGKAGSIALADGSVPVGKYSRQALMNLGLLEKREDPASFTTQEVSDALGGVEISEQGNVSKVLAAVEEGSCEVGTTYLSDTYGHEYKVRIIEEVSYDVTGNIIYPAALVVNKDASSEQSDMAAAFLEYITNDSAKEKYAEHLFDPDVE